MTICLRNIKSFFVESWNLKKGKVIKHANGVGLKTLMDGIFELSSFNRFFSQFRVLQSRFGIQIRLFQTQYSSSVLLLFIDQIKNFYMVCYYHNYFNMHKYYFWRLEYFLTTKNQISLNIRISWTILFFHDTLLCFIQFYAHLCSHNITFLFPFLFSKYVLGKPGESKLEFKERIVKSVVLKFYIYSLLIVRN